MADVWQSSTHNLCTLNQFSVVSRPITVVQLLMSLFINIIYLICHPLNKLTLTLKPFYPLADGCFPTFTPSERVSPLPLHHLNLFGSSAPLNKLYPHSFNILPLIIIIIIKKWMIIIIIITIIITKIINNNDKSFNNNNNNNNNNIKNIYNIDNKNYNYNYYYYYYYYYFYYYYYHYYYYHYYYYYGNINNAKSIIFLVCWLSLSQPIHIHKIR